MDLRHPSHAVLGENKARVFMTLATLADPSSGRRIHDISGIKALRTTQRILDDLVGVGLVDRRAIGASNSYSLNRTHILWQPIQDLLATPARVEIEISKILTEQLKGAAVGTALFGSLARGKAGPDSDIDVLIIWAEHISEERATPLLSDVSDRISRLTGNPAQLFAVTQTELGKLTERNDPLVQSIRTDARPLTSVATVQQLLGQK